MARSEDFRFEDVRLEDWTSLTQLMEPVRGVSDVRFTDVTGLELPSLVPSVLKGSVQGVSLDGVSLGGTLVKNDAQVPLAALAGAEAPSFSDGAPLAQILMAPGMVRPGKKVRMEAARDADACLRRA